MELIALFSLVVILYTYVGYPAIVFLWGKIARQPFRGRDVYEPTVSICLAVHDGGRHVQAKIRSLQRLEYPPEKIQILIYSDGSIDETDAVVTRLARSDPRIRFIAGDKRRGKPTALNHLRAAARGEVLLMCDVRQRIAPGSLRALVRELSDPSVGCVSGKLVQVGDTGASAYGRYEHFIRKWEARAASMIGVAGSIYAIRRAHMPQVPVNVLLDDMFVPLSVVLSQRKRIVLAEEAEAYDEACDDEQEFLRKVRTLAGNYQLLVMMPRLLVPVVNAVWFQLASHKLLRLACPWALIALFVASGDLTVVIGGAATRALFLAQVMFYALALLGAAVGRLGSWARTFVVLNAAAVLGLWRYARGTQAVTWQTAPTRQ
jgi:cellulose synthase/poly-beta-1,6-N-acetylglucosamine synthase-like glycosyltransferase